jgi:hypothetical protein
MTPCNPQVSWASNLVATPSTTNFATRLTANATPHAKGTYSQIVASTAYDVHGMFVTFAGSTSSATRTDQMMDIAIGSATETVILPEFLTGWRAAQSTGPQTVFFPFFIPKGTRIAARLQSLIASDTLDVMFTLVYGSGPKPERLYTRADAYGTTAASSNGTSHTPGNSGAESTAASIGGTLSKNYCAVMLQVQGSLATTTMTNIAYHWELQIGNVTKAEWYTVSHTTEQVNGPYPNQPIHMRLPSGTQLQIRAEASGTAIAHDVAYYCFY